MLQTFRNFFKSKVGIVITLAFLGLIALAFASGDVASSGTFGGVSGGDRVAIVGDEKVSTSDLSLAVTNSLNQIRRDNPTATMDGFIASDGIDRTLQSLLDRTAVAVFGRFFGLRAGGRLVDSELLQIPAFKGPDGEFDELSFRSAIAQQGLTEKLVRADIEDGLLAQQVMLPISLGSTMPAGLAKRYAALLRERRRGSISMLPSSAYAPSGDPTDEQLQTYYDENSSDYIRPERRIIRYAVFGDAALGNLAAPTEEEIAAVYERDAVTYAASELRGLTQLVVPTQAAADAILTEVSGGKSFDSAAREKGLTATQVAPISRSDLATQASTAVAQAVFTTKRGELAQPTLGSLGYYILRVDQVQNISARSLKQVSAEIANALKSEKRRAALADLSAQVEEQLDEGGSLTEVAESLELELTTTPEVLADGKLYGRGQETASRVLAPAISTVFAMDEGEPQLAEVDPGITFLIYEVTEIISSSVAPLDDIRGALGSAWVRSEGSNAAKDAADRILKRLEAGSTVTAAKSEEDKTLPRTSQINFNREELTQMGSNVPPVLALMFSMAQGTVKRLEAPNKAGWFVVKLDKIEAGAMDDDDPSIANARQALSQVISNEYTMQFSRAVQAEVGVERNQAAIDAVEAQLTGRSN